jgi:hypothetical protein
VKSISYAVLFMVLSCLVVRVGSPRKLVAVALAGAMLLALVAAPEPARAQSGIFAAIQAVLSVINGLIQTALTSIQKARSVLRDLQQAIVWPEQMINQARTQITQMISRYRNLMANIIQINLKSATLPLPQTLEATIRDHQVNDFSSLTSAFGNTYGLSPLATAASSRDRVMSDMDDAAALDSLKLLKASDQAIDIELKSADSLENQDLGISPGAAPFLTAAAIVSDINSQALSQKMLAAELRQEAARLAHRNTLRKENANNTTVLRGLLVNLLQHQ